MERPSSKGKSKSLCIFPVVAWLLLTTTVLLSATSIRRVNASVSWDWGDSTVGSSVVADDQEFLVDSQFGNVLASGGSNVYRALRQGQICSHTFYRRCLESGGGNLKTRPCLYRQQCRH
ncbi:uncharacterized protein LOC113750781 [Coffea eugenioides]|uniref:uncharacterized protein LOC113750781 n=1 Tax=Coffea eugenioides TaxID=49369 RepID=UPI000F60811A|nr:uncharacterized protein LOC113750781 [Coffea eugenioides]